MHYFFDRETKELKAEPIYGKAFLSFLFTTKMGLPMGRLLAKFPFFSQFLCWWFCQSWTKKKIPKFIARFNIDPTEFEQSVESFSSFNAFFIRRLKKGSRPLAEEPIIPADGRYLMYQNISLCGSFIVKNQSFSLKKLMGSESLANNYADGSMVMANLAPSDYHRFHFPCDCVPGKARLINGTFFPTHPLSLLQNITTLTENKRMITELKTHRYGTILFIEVGAMAVASIHQTYQPGVPHKKGGEKGYFSFGGSSLVLFFEKGRVQLASDILANSAKCMETLCRLGQPLTKPLE